MLLKNLLPEQNLVIKLKRWTASRSCSSGLLSMQMCNWCPSLPSIFAVSKNQKQVFLNSSPHPTTQASLRMSDTLSKEKKQLPLLFLCFPMQNVFRKAEGEVIFPPRQWHCGSVCGTVVAQQKGCRLKSWPAGLSGQTSDVLSGYAWVRFGYSGFFPHTC